MTVSRSARIRYRFWLALSYLSVERQLPSGHGGKYVGLESKVSTKSLSSGITVPAAWLITRNPYVRALSLYLDKIKASCTTQSAGRESFSCFKNVTWSDGGSSVFRDDMTFEQFVEALDQEARGRPCSVRGMQEHACEQVAGCSGFKGPVYQLKSERQQFWYPCLVRMLGVEQLVSSGWSEFTHGQRTCYNAPRGSCDTALELPTEEELAMYDGRGELKHEGTLHATSAWVRLAEHYTPRAADIVTKLYAEDLKMLRYPVWDGVSEFHADFPYSAGAS